MRKKNEIRLTLPEDRKAKPTPAVQEKAVSPVAERIVPQPPSKRISKSRKETLVKAASRSAYAEFLEIFMRRAWDVVDSLEIKRSTVREIKHINKGVCHLSFTDGSSKYANMGMFNEWWPKYSQEETDGKD